MSNRLPFHRQLALGLNTIMCVNCKVNDAGQNYCRICSECYDTYAHCSCSTNAEEICPYIRQDLPCKCPYEAKK